MNWLDTQTKEILQRVHGDKTAPPKAAEFGLVLLRKGKDHQRLIDATAQINKCGRQDATLLTSRNTPVVINPGLTEGEALWGQFELICCDSISIFLRSEVIEQNDKSYLYPLFEKVLESAEFKPVAVAITHVPNTEMGKKFVGQFLGESSAVNELPLFLKIPFKKARIMAHWAERVGAQLKLDSDETTA